MLKQLLSATILAGVVLSAAPAAIARDSVEGTAWNAKERFQLRARAIGIFADGDGTVTPGGLATDLGNSVTPEVDVTYFFTDHIAAELIAATAQHEVDAAGSNLGNTWILPPTLTLQYHFQPGEQFSPYIGAGINYSIFYGEEDGAGFTDLDVGNGFGLALQVGADYWLNENWGLNADVKYVDLNVDTSVSGGTLMASDVEVDPWIVGVGVAYRF